MKNPKTLTPQERLARIAEIIVNVDDRCMAYDGAVGDTLEEMTKDEIREIYQMAIGKKIKYTVDYKEQ
jgi:hypothetical protein